MQWYFPYTHGSLIIDEIYSGDDPSMYIYCVFNFQGIAASCLRSVGCILALLYPFVSNVSNVFLSTISGCLNHIVLFYSWCFKFDFDDSLIYRFCRWFMSSYWELIPCNVMTMHFHYKKVRLNQLNWKTLIYLSQSILGNYLNDFGMMQDIVSQNYI